MSETKEQILKIRDLDITFQTTAGSVHAIRGVNIDLMLSLIHISEPTRH